MPFNVHTACMLLAFTRAGTAEKPPLYNDNTARADLFVSAACQNIAARWSNNS